jgi:hypothetical protein
VSLHKRLEKLEGRASFSAREAPDAVRSRAMERWLHAHESARRVIEGREPLPDLPYTDEDRENDRAFLQESIPDIGWGLAGRQRRPTPSSTTGSSSSERD